MSIRLLLAAILPLVAFSRAQELTCDQPRRSPLKVSVNSWQNITGHWTSKVELQQRAVQELKGSTVDIEHNTAACASMDETGLNIILTFKAPPYQATLPTLPKGYEFFPDVGVYKFHTDVSNWTTARQICAEEGAHLAIINSEKEGDVMKTLLARHPEIAGAVHQDSAWVGVFRLAEQYFTVLGDPLASTGYVRWGPGQPHRGNEDCILVLRNTAELADITCDWKVAFICERKQLSSL